MLAPLLRGTRENVGAAGISAASPLADGPLLACETKLLAGAMHAVGERRACSVRARDLNLADVGLRQPPNRLQADSSLRSLGGAPPPQTPPGMMSHICETSHVAVEGKAALQRAAAGSSLTWEYAVHNRLRSCVTYDSRIRCHSAPNTHFHVCLPWRSHGAAETSIY